MRGRRRAGLVVLVLAALAVPAAASRVAAEPPASTHDPDEVRELADDVLAREEFQPPEDTLLERFLDWLVPGDSDSDGTGGDGTGSGGEASSGGGGGSGAFTTILLVAALVAVGYVASVLLRQPRRRRPEDDGEPEVEVASHRTARQWLAAAEQAEAEGRWKDGLRARFRGLVEELTEGGVVPEVAGRTTGELRVDVAAGLPAAAGAFGEAAELFDRAWYGDLPTGPEEARRFAAAAATVAAEVPRRPAPVPEPVEVDA